MEKREYILGVDVGSVAVAVAAVAVDKTTLQTACGFHHGNIQQTLERLLDDFNLSSVRQVAATVSSPSSLKTTRRYDNRIAVINAARRLHDKVGSILIVGGEKFSLIRFDEEGNYLGYKANTSCAAGTGSFLEMLSSKAVMTAVTHLEKKYHKYFMRVLKETEPDYSESPESILSQYNVRIENTGESMENILKIHYLLKHHPDIALFVQASPAFCCPSLVTEAMAKDIERNTGVPIVSITYDGTGGDKNDPIIPYLNYLREGKQEQPIKKRL